MVAKAVPPNPDERPTLTAPPATPSNESGASPPPAPAYPFRPGLEGVPATQSAICDIDGLRGVLTYRGYPVEHLARQSSFLETTNL